MFQTYFPAIAYFSTMVYLLCCRRKPLSENSKRLRAFGLAFTAKNRNKLNPPEFYDASYLRHFEEFYEEDTHTLPNPTGTTWWPSVTQADIDAAFIPSSAMHAFMSSRLR